MANALTYIQGPSGPAQLGALFDAPLVVRVTDATTGNGVSGAEVVFSVPTEVGMPSGLLNGTSTTYTTTSDGNGYAASDVVAAVAAGSWIGLTQLTAALGTSCSWGLTNLPVAPASVVISQGQNLRAALNAAYGTLSATVRDGGGSLLSGAVVQFSVPAGHGTFPGGLTTVTATTDGTGIAIAPTFTANNVPGTFTLTVTVPVAPALSATTTWGNIDPAIPTTVQNISGGGQQASTGTSFANALRSRVTNGLGNPVAGVTVTYTSPAAGASCTFPAATLLAVIAGVTDANGYAQTPTPLANAIGGTYYVTATSPGTTAAQFQLTNGVTYLPEVCTTSLAPAGAANALGLGQPWANTSQALSGTTGSTVTIPSVSNFSDILRCSPTADLSAIADGAKINKWIATFDIKGVNGGGGQPVVTSGIYNGTAVRSGSFNDSTTGTFSQKTHTYNLSGSLTGAQLKAGNFGVGFNSDNIAGSATVRLVKLSVCYQNPDVPAVGAAGSPLQLCEA